MGLRAEAPDLPGLFEEAASALADASADRGPGDERPSPGAEAAIDLAAADLAALAFAWLNELIGLAQSRGEALSRAVVTEVEQEPDGWRLRGRAAFVPFARRGRGGPRARVDVKSATFHRLAVRPARGGWEMTAYLDV
jgi:SHS2 domain-containing protein